MLRNLLFTLCITLMSCTLALAQHGRLQGNVLEKDTKEPVPFANIVLENGGTIVGGATSDFDGKYDINPIPPGTYTLKATFVGYATKVTNGVVITSNKITFEDIVLTPSAISLAEVEVIDYKIPLISKDQTASGASVTAEEIAKMPNRSAEAVAATVGGVFSADGERGNVRGARSDATAVYIDGVRVIGSSSVPQSAISQVDVILGGTPAQYGDATGGVINMVTKGPSRTFGAGIEAETSEFLDAFGSNRLGFSLQGPLIKGKKQETALIGFFLAGDFTYNKDGEPSAIGYYKAKDEVINEIGSNPLRPSGFGTGTYRNGEFVRGDQMEHIKTSMNTSNYGVTLSGNINIRTTETINLTFGGNFNKSHGNSFSYAHSYFNYDKNQVYDENTWRVYGRFSQRFPTDPESTSLIKNFYYTVQADYTRQNNYYGDPDHWDDVFKYGYVGKFSVLKTPTFEPGTVTVNGHTYTDVNVLNSWDYDTLVVWNPSDINPLVANFTTRYFDSYDDPLGNYQNFTQIMLGGGLLNGNTSGAFYTMYGAPGAIQSGYSFNDNDQFAVNVSGAMTIGNHEIRLGLQYEQRNNRYLSYAPVELWTLMRGLTNAHILELDMDNPYLISHGGIVDTVMYPRLYDAASQTTFDYNLRRKLGLPVSGTDYILIDSYDFNNHTIEYYDENGKMHTINVGENLFELDLFSAAEMLGPDGSTYVSYAGYDYKGNRLKGRPSFEDFFNEVDENGNYTRPIGAFQPIYMAGYIQDKFAFRDLIFNIGVRVDRFDANQKVLKDPYLLYNAKTAGEVSTIDGQPVNHPGNIGSDYVVYVNNNNNPTEIAGYRNENIWYNAGGAVIQDPSALDRGSGISPYLQNKDQQRVDIFSFKDYEPQWSVMPRISFSFPISDEALFFAHYDVLTQRPTSNLQATPVTYYYFNALVVGGTRINNPALKPTQTIDYELGFTQKLTNTSSLTLTGFYREMRNMIQVYRFTGAYPTDYTSFNNLDFGTVKGITLDYDLRRTKNVRVRASYTLQFANATGATTTTAASLIAAGLPNLRSTIPMPWDRRHQFNLLLDYRFGKGKEYNGPVIKREKKDKAPLQVLNNTGFSLTLGGGSGTPYTAAREITSVFVGSSSLLKGTYYGSRLPWQFRLDFKLDKDIDIKLGKKEKENKRNAYLNVYLQILNILDTKNIMEVYPATGNPGDDGYLTAPEYQRQINTQLDPVAFTELYSLYMNDPSHYSAPRQIRLGVIFNF